MLKIVGLALLGLLFYWILTLLTHAEKNAEREDILKKYNEGQWKN